MKGERHEARARRRAPVALIIVAGIPLALLVALLSLRPRGEAPPSGPPPAGRPSPPPLPAPPEAAERLARAKELVLAGRGAEAVPLIEEAIAVLRRRGSDPRTLSEAHYNLCVALRGTDDPDRALAEALDWLAAHPDDPGHDLLAGSMLFERGRYADAAPLLEKGLAADPEEIRRKASDPRGVLCQLAECQRILGRTGEARRTIERVLAEDPRHRAARRVAASLAFGRRDIPRALEMLEDLFREDPSDPITAVRLARTAVEAGRPERAVEVVRDHFASGGARGEDLLLWYARALAASGGAKEAVGVAAEILVRHPDHDEAYFVLADALTRAGKPDLARPFRARHARAAPIRSELDRAATAASAGYPESAAYYRARAFANAGRLGAAIRELRTARRLAPRNGRIVAALAEVLLEADRVEDAEGLLARFGEGAGTPAEFSMARARVALARGRDADAMKALRAAAATGRKAREIARLAVRIALLRDSPAAVAMALALFEGQAALDPEVKAWTGIEALLEGDAEAARERLDAAVEAIPSPSAAVWLALGRARLRTDRRPEAAEAFRKAVEAEDLLHSAWEGLAAASEDDDEIARARAWLGAQKQTEEAIRREWANLRGEADARASSEALLRVARLRYRLGEPRRARALAALARDMDPGNPAAHRLVVMLHDGPEDTFVRLHSLEALRRLAPSDRVAEAKRRAEYMRLGFAPPGAEGPDHAGPGPAGSRGP